MPDQAIPGLPRIALVFGNEAAVAHVREAMAGHADIVYATSAAEFDAARMAGAHAAAALVNLDDGDWLDGIEERLNAAGIAVVYNDPEISRGLDGWERARWLRHLLAKLRGSSDVDPPRPEHAGPPAGNMPVAVGPKAPAPAVREDAAVELPLSPREIETMTADFAAIQETASAQVGEAASAAETPAAVRIETVAADARPDTALALEAVDEIGLESDADLDVDTETLSAMIDARLADSELPTPSDSTEVWRVVEGGAAPPVPPGTNTGADAHAVPGAGEPAGSRRVETAARDDSDVLASLPSLDDWQLVDPDADPAPAATRAHKDAAPAFPDNFAGLELVPLEVAAPVANVDEPIGQWVRDGTSEVVKSHGGKA